MSESNKVVYLHKDSEGIVRYVGSGTVERAYSTYANSNRGKKYTEYVEANGKLEVEIVAEGLTKLEAENLERELYDKFKGSILNHKKPSSAKLISKEMFEEYLYYDETSATCLRWKVNIGHKIKADAEAGCLSKNGYYEVKLQGVIYKSHRIVALLHDLEVDGFVIDHIDRDRTNNKISNLRVVTPKENNQNRSQCKLSSNNSSGVQGVCYNKQRDYWVASWYENGNQIKKHFPIKNYETSEAAFQAAVEYRKKMVDLCYNN